MESTQKQTPGEKNGTDEDTAEIAVIKETDYSPHGMLLTGHRRQGIAAIDTAELPAEVSARENERSPNQATLATHGRPGNGMHRMNTGLDTLDTLKLPGMLPGIAGTRTAIDMPVLPMPASQKGALSRGKV